MSSVSNEEFAKRVARDSDREADEAQQPRPEQSPEPRLQEDVVPEDEWLPADEFAALSQVQKAAYQARLRSQKDLERQLREEREAHQAQMAQMLEASRANANPAPEVPKGDFDGINDDDLSKWYETALRVQAEAARQPDNEQIQAEYAKIDPSYVVKVQREMIRREASSIAAKEIAPLRKQYEGQTALASAEQNARNYIAGKYGAQVLLDSEPDSPKAKAMQRVAEIKKNLGLSNVSPDVEAALVISAMDAEMAASNRGGQSRDMAGLRRQELEGVQRQAMAPSSARSAARARGDTEADFRLGLESMMDSLNL